MRSVLLAFVSIVLASTNAQSQSLIFDNGPFVTNPSAGFNGADVSIFQNVTLGYTSLGYGVNNNGPIRLTEQFTNTIPWQIDYIDVYAYQTGSTSTSTFTGGFAKIWNADPSTGTAVTEFGDFTTNRMLLTDFTNCYRVQENVSILDTNRPIMRTRIAINAVIQPGTHWIEWGLTGTLASGPFAPAISILGVGNTGDAKQFNLVGYTGTLVNGTHNIGIPFKLYGSQFVAAVPSPTAVCQGGSVTIDFTDAAIRNVGNTYTLELSDASGNFPGTLLTTTVNSATQLAATIPAATAASTSYKIRVLASSPSDSSATTGTFTINANPNAPVVVPSSIALNPGQYTTFFVNNTGTFTWYNASNVQVGTGTTFVTPLTITATTYTVTNASAAGCTTPTTVPISIVAPPTFSGRKRN